MIKIERPRETPDALTSKRSHRYHAKAVEFFSRPQAERGTERFHWHSETWSDLFPDLDKAFHEKCAFCEASAAAVNVLMALHFRPTNGAKALGEKQDPDHYFWLALEWENLYLACNTCYQNKGWFFPLAGPRGSLNTPLETLRREERPLLIDPCLDDPLGHLKFLADGRVKGRVINGENRGQITIEIFGLNRSELQEARREANLEFQENEWENLLSSLEKAEEAKVEGAAGAVLAAIADDKPFAGMKRDRLGQRMEHEWGEKTDRRFENLECSSAGNEIVKFWRKYQEVTEGAEDGHELEESILGLITRVYIENFRSIGKLDLKFSARHEGGKGITQAPWKVLLGDNGVGKSSILKAVALALMGDARARRELKQNKIEPADLVRRDHTGNTPEGVERALVRVEAGRTFEFQVNTRTVCDENGNPLHPLQFNEGSEGVRATVIRAYGPTRIIDRKKGLESDRRGKQFSPQRIENLFDVNHALVNVEKWLASHWDLMKEPINFVLKDLLELESGSLTVRETADPENGEASPRKEVWMTVEKSQVRVSELSSGYKTVLALAIDIMAGLDYEVYQHDLSQASGLILLDEIGSHLHPRWRQQIVKRLRKTFSNMQFLATTHEPLCLRGLKNGEVDVLKRDEETAVVSIEENLPPIEGLRTDQLLTSPYFGLNSTIDPELEKQFQEYYELLAEGDRLIAEDKIRRREELANDLSRYGILGSTRRDQMIYKIIDELLAKNENAIYEPIDPETRDRLKRIWDRSELEEAEP